MFKNLVLYHLKAFTLSPDAAEDALAKLAFTPTGQTQIKSMGWAPPRDKDNAGTGKLLEVIGDHWIMSMKTERRVLPGAVVAAKLEEVAKKIELATGRKPGKKALKDLKEQVTLELLPAAFTQQSTVSVWIDLKQSMLAISTTSPARAEDIVSLLVKTFDSVAVSGVQTKESPAACMAAWLMDGVPPEGLTCDRDCELRTEDEMKSVVRYTRHSLDADAVREQLKAGMRPTKLAMTFKDRVSFVLTDTLQVKKIAVLDIVFEGASQNPADDAFDGDMALATGELSAMLSGLIFGLGGLAAFEDAGAAAGAGAAQSSESSSAESSGYCDPASTQEVTLA